MDHVVAICTYGKFLSGTREFKPMLFKGQLYLINVTNWYQIIDENQKTLYQISSPPYLFIVWHLFKKWVSLGGPVSVNSTTVKAGCCPLNSGISIQGFRIAAASSSSLPSFWSIIYKIQFTSFRFCWVWQMETVVTTTKVMIQSISITPKTSLMSLTQTRNFTGRRKGI